MPPLCQLLVSMVNNFQYPSHLAPWPHTEMKRDKQLSELTPGICTINAEPRESRSMSETKPASLTNLASHPIEIRRLQIFVHAARELCFATSAENLNLTPSAVSHAIRSLEEELSSTLFVRNGPKVTLTRVGSRLLPVAEDLLDRMEGLRHKVSSIDDESRRLRLLVPEFLSATLLSQVLPDFFECFPSFRVEISISEEPGRKDSDPSRPEWDLHLGFDFSESANFVRRDLFRSQFQFYVAPFHALASVERVQMRDMARHRIFVPHANLMRQLCNSGLPDDNESHLAWLLPSHESVTQFAQVGAGAALIGARTAAPLLESKALTPVSYVGAPISAMCSAFWPASAPPSWAAEVFLSFVEMAEGL